MNYTHEKPSLPGHYWWRAGTPLPPIIVRLHMDGADPNTVDGWIMSFIGQAQSLESNKVGGHWAGPLEPPEEAP